MFCSCGQISDIYFKEFSNNVPLTIDWLEGCGASGTIYMMRGKNDKPKLGRLFFHRVTDPEEDYSSLEIIFLKAWISAYERGKFATFRHASSMLDTVSRHSKVKPDYKRWENPTLGVVHENYVIRLNNNLVRKIQAPAWSVNRRIQELYEVNL